MTRFKILLTGFLIFFVSCTRETHVREIFPPPTPALTSDSRWGVIRVSYIKVLVNIQDKNTEVIGLLRKGDNVRLVSRKFNKQSNNYWLEIQSSKSDISGWVPNVSVELFDSRIQAQIASMEMPRK